MSIPTVAVVGRPNVGKSTLFNKLIGQRMSIVDDTPGVTRDRVLGKCEWRNHFFWLVDTGGIEPESNDKILQQMRRQAELAIMNAQVIVLVVDLQSGLSSTDHAVASMLLKSGKPIVLCVNKCDSVGELPMGVYEFYNLGLGEPYPVSSLHGHGTGELLDRILELLADESMEEEEDASIHVAVVGKPNAGKSSLVNELLGENRVIVSPVAGTTRDAVDTYLEYDGQSYVFIDTAGIRRKSKVLDDIEKYSVLRAQMAINRADVCIIMLDANEGFTEQDSKIAGYAHDQGKASIIAVNKWDLIEKDNHTMQKFKKTLQSDFSFMPYVSYAFISAKTGQRVRQLFPLIQKAYQENRKRITTGALNDFLSYVTARVQPPSDKGKRLKIYYMTQASVKPPTFVIFVNKKELFHFSYLRYIENQLRESFDFSGTPIRFIIRQRGETQ